MNDQKHAAYMVFDPKGIPFYQSFRETYDQAMQACFGSRDRDRPPRDWWQHNLDLGWTCRAMDLPSPVRSHVIVGSRALGSHPDGDLMLAIAWPDGSETLELVSSRAASLLGFDPEAADERAELLMADQEPFAT